MNLSLLMTGLSSTGKTTFLAALWELLNSPASPPGAIRLAREPEDRRYFFEIGRTWLQFEELGHSNVEGPRHTEMPLLTPSGAEVSLRIPDIVGESFASAWEGREWPSDVAEIARASNGLLIFVHGGRLKPPVLLPPGEPSSGAEGSRSDQQPAEWVARNAPTQTQLADLLEGVSEICRPLPTAIIVSAWDEVIAEAVATPQSWLQVNLPLLWQMLEGRSDSEPPYAVFGISAQGGDVTDPEVRARLAKMEPSYKRIIVQHGEHVDSDITAPIRWLLEAT